jgi:cation-transporting ATPase E
VPRVLRFAVPAGVGCAAAVFTAFWLARGGTDVLNEQRTSAVIALFLTTWWVLVMIAKPLNWWRIELVAGMAVLFAASLAIPFVRHLFALDAGDLSADLTAVVISLVAAVAISAVVKVAGTLRA